MTPMNKEAIMRLLRPVAPYSRNGTQMNKRIKKQNMSDSCTGDAGGALSSYWTVFEAGSYLESTRSSQHAICLASLSVAIPLG